MRGGRALLLTASLVVALGLAEVALRLAWKNPYRGEGVDSVLRLQIHHPGLDQIVDRKALDPDTPRVRFRTDERSYILPSRRHSEPDLTIVFLGGSTTECRAVREDLRFPALVSEILAGRGIRANTLNAARSGNTLHDSLMVLLNHVVTDRPDIAVLMHATNDTGVLARDGSYRSRMGQPVAPRNLAKWTLQLLSRRLQLAGLLRASLPPALRERDGGARDSGWRETAPAEPYRRRLDAFVLLSRVFDIQPVLVTQPLSSQTNELTPGWADFQSQRAFNEVLREVGAQRGVPVIDLVRILEQEVPDRDAPMEIFYDGIHVTDRGSRIYAEVIAEQLAAIASALP